MQLLAASEHRHRLAGRFGVVGMHEVVKGARKQLLAGVAERALESEVHALEVAVDRRDAQQIEREVKEVLELAVLVSDCAMPHGHRAQRVRVTAKLHPARTLLDNRS